MKIVSTSVYNQWLDSLRNLVARARIQARIERLATGNPGDWRDLKGGLRELKTDTGPGFRVYYTQRGDLLIVLLCGGNKRTQRSDIAHARQLLEGL